MSVQLTVIAKGEDGKVIEGASVSVAPGEVTDTTDSKGEVTLHINGADRYDVTVSNEEATQTVPYYSLKGRETARLEVNLAYLTKQENQQRAVVASSENPVMSSDSVLPVAGGVVIGIFLLTFVILLARKRRLKKSQKTEVTPVKDKVKAKKSQKRDSKK